MRFNVTEENYHSILKGWNVSFFYALAFLAAKIFLELDGVFRHSPWSYLKAPYEFILSAYFVLFLFMVAYLSYCYGFKLKNLPKMPVPNKHKGLAKKLLAISLVITVYLVKIAPEDSYILPVASFAYIIIFAMVYQRYIYD